MLPFIIPMTWLAKSLKLLFFHFFEYLFIQLLINGVHSLHRLSWDSLYMVPETVNLHYRLIAFYWEYFYIFWYFFIAYVNFFWCSTTSSIKALYYCLSTFNQSLLTADTSAPLFWNTSLVFPLLGPYSSFVLFIHCYLFFSYIVLWRDYFILLF